MIENFKSLINALNEEYLLELYHICNMRYFEMYVNGNDEYAKRYNDICIYITRVLRNRGIFK